MPSLLTPKIYDLLFPSPICHDNGFEMGEFFPYSHYLIEVCSIRDNPLGLTIGQSVFKGVAAEEEGKVRSFSVSTGFVKTPLALSQIPAQAEQRGITQEEVVRDVMMGASRIKEMMSPIEVANLFIFGFSRFSKYLIGGDLLFDGGVVLTY